MPNHALFTAASQSCHDRPVELIRGLHPSTDPEGRRGEALATACGGVKIQTSRRHVMNRRLSLVLVLTGLVLMAGSTFAQAQEILTGEIPFTFVAGGRAHDPGRYELRVGDDQMTLTLMPEGKGVGSELLPETRLAIPAGSVPDSRLVFDKVGNTYFLSEAWFPGEDGYVLHIEKAPHSHQTIRVERKARKDR
jgi:hypothetical protein